MKKYYSVEELKAAAMDAIKDAAWEDTPEQVRDYVRAYRELFEYLENKEEKQHDQVHQ